MTISGAPVPSINHLVRAFSLKATRTEDLWYNAYPGYTLRFHLLGRYAMARGIKAIENVVKHSNATVWLPDYFCKEATEHLQAEAIRLKFYPISKDLSPDWDSLENLVERDGRLKIFVLVHYFGFCNDVRRAKKFCDGHGMLLLEDAAHIIAPYEDIGGSDMIVYCPRKLFAVPSGAVLVIRDEFGSHLENESIYSSTKGVLRWTVLSLFKAVLLQLRVPWHLLRTNGSLNIRVDKPNQFERLSQQSCNPYARNLLSVARSDLSSIIAKRRTNYFSIASSSEGASGAHPFYPTIDKAACPFVFPMYVENNIEKVIARLNRFGIPAGRWPLLPSEILADPSNHQVAINTYNHLMLLPVHQGISERWARRIGQALRDVLHSL